MAAAASFNLRNPSVKRIMQEMKEFQKDQSPELYAEALESNIFEWHFVVRGAPESEFEGGLYHGRILLPSEYPFKPPSFLMLTPNGRFETGMKVCLSISSHHPEHWQPSWSIRTALVALIAFMQTPGNGAIGSLDYSKEERKEYAQKSRVQPPAFGNAERQAITNAAHEAMLQREKLLGSTATPSAAPAQQRTEASAAAATKPDRLAQGSQAAVPGPEGRATEPPAAPSEAAPLAAPAAQLRQRGSTPAQPQAQQATPSSVWSFGAAPQGPHVHSSRSPAAAAQYQPADAPPSHGVQPSYTTASATASHSWEEVGLTALAALLVVAMAVLLLRKFMIGYSALDATSQSFF